MLSDHENRKQVPSQRRRAVGKTNKHWSDSQKLEAVTTFLLLGSIAQTAIALKIPEQTMYHWKATQWWKEMVDLIRLQDKIVVSGRLKNVIDKSLSVMEERLENGDWFYDQKTGDVRRKPVTLKDATAVANMAMDQKHKIVTEEQQQVHEEAMHEKLEKLAKSFEEFAHQKELVTEAPIAEDIDYEEK